MSHQVTVTVIPVTVIVDREIVAGGGKGIAHAIDAACEACEEELTEAIDEDSGLVFLSKSLPRWRKRLRDAFKLDG